MPARYVLGERLGAGATGETYAAVDSSDGAACVVKLFAAGDEARGAALAELAGLRTLAHASVVRVRDVGRASDGRMFITTDRVSGAPASTASPALSTRRSGGRVLQRAARDLAGALAHVHSPRHRARRCLSRQRASRRRRARHPDRLRPRRSARRRAWRRARHVGYAPPEALTGDRTPAVDLFALGATLYEAWSGTAPFGRGLPAVQRMLGEAAPTLSSIRPGLGEGWDQLFGRLLSADPAAGLEARASCCARSCA